MNFKVYLFCILSYFLVGFIIHYRYPAFEVFPAFQLPTGPGKVQLADTIYFNDLEFFARKKGNDDLVEVSKKKLWYPMPIQYLYPVLGDSLGLKMGPKNVEVSLFSSRVKFHLTSKGKTREDVQEVKTYLGAHLARLGYLDDTLIIHQVRNALVLGEGKKYKVKTLKVEKISLPGNDGSSD